MDRTEAIVCQHLYWKEIINNVRKEGSNYDTCQHKTRSNKKYGKLPAKLVEEIPRNKICVYLIGPYIIKGKGTEKKLHLKAVTMIYPVTGWFEISQYYGKIGIYYVRS